MTGETNFFLTLKAILFILDCILKRLREPFEERY